MVALNQLTTGNNQQGAATVKRRKKSTGAPNPKKMFEEVSFMYIWILKLMRVHVAI